MASAISNGTTIFYDTAGDGPPLVMLYGIGGSGRRWWDAFPRRLAEQYRLILIDNRGTGRSDKPSAAWTMADMTGDVQAVLDAERIDSFHLLGCSLGTVIARHFVAQRGGRRLRSLSLLCPPNGILATEEDLKAAVFWDPAKPLVESERGAWPVIHPQTWIAPNEARLLAEFDAKMAEPTPPLTYHVQFGEAVAAGDPNPALAEYDWPILILHGTADRLVPPENARTLAAAVPRARLTWLDGDGHNFWQHDPERSAEAVLAFLAGAEANR